MEGWRDYIEFYINGKRYVENKNSIEPEATLLSYLRSEKIGLKGTKLGCGEGGCGACTVMISRWEPKNGKITHRAVNGCLFPLCGVDGCFVTTVEGIGNSKIGLNPVQKEIAECGGSQCGFCTPGIVVALYAYLREHPNATQEEIEHNLDGNLCRCTGYRPILDAAKKFGSDSSERLNPSDYIKAQHNLVSESTFLLSTATSDNLSGVKICPSTGRPCDCNKIQDGEPVDALGLVNSKVTSNFIFPKALKKVPTKVEIAGPRVKWIAPSNFGELLDAVNDHPTPHGRIVCGCSEVAIEWRLKNVRFDTMIYPMNISELKEIKVLPDGISIGGCVPLVDLKEELLTLIQQLEVDKTRTFTPFIDQLDWFASRQIRNVATIGGNVATASPISDLNPVLMSVAARITLASKTEGERVVPASEFFVGYRKTVMKHNEVIKSLFVPFSRPLEYCKAFKQAHRREDDISIVTSSMRVYLEKKDDKFYVKEVSLAYGGMAPVSVKCPQTETSLISLPWDESLLQVAYNHLPKDLPLAPTAPGGMIKFRRSLTLSFFLKFYYHVVKSLHPEAIPPNLQSISGFRRPISSGTQNFPDGKKEMDPVTFPLIHRAAYLQVTGEAVYTDDMPNLPHTLYGVFVQSTKPHAHLEGVEWEELIENDPTLDFVSSTHVLGANEISPSPHGPEKLFPFDLVEFQSQPLGVVLATTHEKALEASRKVKVRYGTELPHAVKIKEAIKLKSYLPPMHRIDIGNVDSALAKSDFVIEGEFESGGQEHFYLEPQTSYAIPGENDEMVVYTSTQNPSETQHVVSHVLGIPQNKVVVKVKRMGGGFGGKETRSIYVSAAAAVAAKKTGRPVKIVLDRDVDMATSGGRHPFLFVYKVGVKRSGKIKAMDIQLFSNGGFSHDLSIPILDRALFHVTNAYFIPNVRAIGHVMKTNVVSNTAFRGFGGPQAMLCCEHIMEKIAHVTKIPSYKLRETNLIQEGQITHYKMLVEHCRIQNLWSQILVQSDYHNRLIAVNEFNKNNRYRKRGISLLPTMYGMSFTVKFLNQAGALVHLYRDGSVLVSHGGTEMGQGLHTKIIQIASHALGVDVSKVHISETSTDKVANTVPTAASVQSDLNGMAVLNACNIINERLAPLKQEFPDLSMSELAEKAWKDRIDLSAHGFYATPDINYDFNTGTGRPFNYHSYGTGCTEVEIDVLTGDVHIIRVDIVMDVGQSLNPAIDVGQVEGAYVQGFGWCTMEELTWFRNGFLFTRGPGNYKIPSFNDTPINFNITLLKDCPNPRAVHSSKGVGEPPFFLATSAFFAIQQAIAAAREEEGKTDFFYLRAPATAERIRVLCEDPITEIFKDDYTDYESSP